MPVVDVTVQGPQHALVQNETNPNGYRSSGRQRRLEVVTRGGFDFDGENETGSDVTAFIDPPGR
jgi:hypothetical protein